MSRGTFGNVPERRCLKPTDWPAEDRRRWAAALQPGDIFDQAGTRSHLAAISNIKAEKGYGRWLTFLRHSGYDLQVAPELRITAAVVGAYIVQLRKLDNGTYTQIARLQELYEAASVMDPRQDWEWIRGIASRIRAQHKPVRDKRGRLVGSDDLFNLGVALMASAETQATERAAATTYRDGLLCAFLALRPLRRKNLAALRLGEHIVRVGDGWMISIPGEETKTGTPIDMPWPESLVDKLEHYVAVHRAVLCAQNGRWQEAVGNALWVSADSSPLTQQSVYDRIVERTRTAFGTAVSPHLFRDCAATALAVEDPLQIRIAAPILGHRTFATTEKYYVKARMVEAVRQFQQNVISLRQGISDQTKVSE